MFEPNGEYGLRRAIALKQVLVQMPEVAPVWEVRSEGGDVLPRKIARLVDSSMPNAPMRFVVVIASDDVQLALSV